MQGPHLIDTLDLQDHKPQARYAMLVPEALEGLFAFQHPPEDSRPIGPRSRPAPVRLKNRTDVLFREVVDAPSHPVVRTYRRMP